MTYFNGSGGYCGRDGIHVPRIAMDRIYCDDCAEGSVPLPPEPYGPPNPWNPFPPDRHYATDFIWTPIYGGGRKCNICNQPV